MGDIWEIWDLPHEPGKMVSPESSPSGPQPEGRTHRQTEPPEWPGVCSTSLGVGLGLANPNPNPNQGQVRGRAGVRVWGCGLGLGGLGKEGLGSS